MTGELTANNMRLFPSRHFYTLTGGEWPIPLKNSVLKKLIFAGFSEGTHLIRWFFGCWRL